jgi:hypothetical protein
MVVGCQPHSFAALTRGKEIPVSMEKKAFFGFKEREKYPAPKKI